LTLKTNKRVLSTTIAFSVFVLLVISTSVNSPAFGDDNSNSLNEITILASEQLQKNPFAMKILENMEIQKRAYHESQTRQKISEADQSILQEKRNLANQSLDVDLDSLKEKYKQYTPKAAFERFVSKVPSEVQGIFWSMFDYQQMKVKAGQEAMKTVLTNGGSFKEASQAYHKNAAITRVEMIELNKNFNIEAGVADPEVQKLFDELGKLPREKDADARPQIREVLFSPNVPQIITNSLLREQSIQEELRENTENDIQEDSPIETQQILEKMEEYKLKKVQLKNELKVKLTELGQVFLDKQNPLDSDFQLKDKEFVRDFIADRELVKKEYSEKQRDLRDEFNEVVQLLADEDSIKISTTALINLL